MITIEGFQQIDREQIPALIVSVKALLYCRVSTSEQAEKGYSLQSQVERCANHVKSKFGYTDDELIAIIEPGEAGDNPDRPGLNQALSLIEQGIGRKMVMLHPDRMSRYLALQTEISQKVWGAGCDLEFVEVDVDPTNPESMLMFNIQGSIAQYNKAKILANSKRGRLQKVKNGKIPGIRRVYGYTFDKDLDTLVENTEEKEVYLNMINWLLNGIDGREMNCSQIARKLAEDGVPAPSGDSWYQATISRILRNELYMGTFYYGKSEIVQNKGKKHTVKKPREQWQGIPIPQYIDEATFQRVQAKLDSLEKKHRGRPSETYLLKGFCRCGRCGGAVGAGVPSTLKDGKKLHYYSCTRKAKKKYEVGTGEPNAVCKGRGWRQDIIDEYVWNYILERLQNPEQIIADLIRQQGSSEQLENMRTKKERIEKSISDKLKQRSRYVEMYAKELITMDELEGFIQPLKTEVDNLTAELAVISGTLEQAEGSYNELERVKEAVAMFNQMVEQGLISYELKRKAVERFIHKVILHEDTIEIVTIWRPLSEGEVAAANSHSNPITSQGQSLNYYLFHAVDLPRKFQRTAESEVDKIAEQLDKLVKMYCDELLTFEEIEQRTSIPWWTVKELFKKNDVERISLSDRARIKRARDFDLIYRLHFEEEMSVRDIYAKFEFSPPYIRAVLGDRGLKPINRGMFQSDKVNEGA